MDAKLLKRLADEIEKIPLYSTHEHTLSAQEKGSVDLFTFIDNWLLGTAGRRVETPEGLDPEARWREISPWVKATSNLGMMRVWVEGFRALYGFEDREITDRNWKELSERITRENERPDWERYVMREKANIERALLDDENSLERDRDLFVPVMRLNQWATPNGLPAALDAFEQKLNLSIRTFDELLHAIDLVVERFVSAGGGAIKNGIAASSISLRYERRTRAEAEAIFNEVMLNWYTSNPRPFIDYIVRYFLERTIDAGIPMQIHTGNANGPGAIISRCNPIGLELLAADYPEANLDIFHAGFPYLREAIALAKINRGVYLDLCWMPWLSPRMTRTLLAEALDSVPATKILAFGGDCGYLEGTIGAAVITRRIVAEVLAEMVEEGAISEDYAVWVARRILYENAKELYDEKSRESRRSPG